MVLPTKLKKGIEYVIRFKNEKGNTNIYYGIFESYGQNKCSCVFVNLVGDLDIETKNVDEKDIYEEFVSIIFFDYKKYNFYDYNKIVNAPYARQKMEKRALDMVLKRVVNEHFEW
jgi:hypothetical protein